MLPLVAKLMTALTALVVGAVTLSLLGLMKGPWAVTLLVALIIGVVGWFVVAMRAARSRVVELFGHDDFSRNLRWGMFYANPADERVVAEHLMSTTLNFARPGAWALLGAILLPVAVIAIVTVAAGKIL
ncbi:hypothetical protein HMPREF0298_1819 [Corynebacterium lipophiloflavum DSM 44291]|uniref:Uncharacterized protein n=1 Tax=Corynebacterium lipophiloflavum (strain ATCC 700352 / DSM 44291 / CCUG 37336 / JCM 10383 / DMMZ 1944) TaxID=525263 RepID=C0XTP9_CORLD|nr:hypothetical protein HMPREF0298_1819 [Corynebacterium lipophiloflavum DSM 44291]